MTRLTFPEPAADLLARSHDILDRHVTPHTPGEAGWAIGGGSALAARWQHRWSKDLDIIVGSETEFARLTEAENPDLWREMRVAGATTIESEAPCGSSSASGRSRFWVTSSRRRPARS